MLTVQELPQKISDLSQSNIDDFKHVQIYPKSNSKGSNFSTNDIEFNWSVSAEQRFIPNLSYVRLRCKLRRNTTDSNLLYSDDIAPNMNLADNLFDSMEFRIENKTVCRLSAGSISQVGAFKKRISKPKTVLDEMEKLTSFSSPWFRERQNEVISDGKKQLDLAPRFLETGSAIPRSALIGNVGNQLSYDDIEGASGEHLFLLNENGGAGVSLGGVSIGDIFYMQDMDGAGNSFISTVSAIISNSGATTSWTTVDGFGTNVANNTRDFFFISQRHKITPLTTSRANLGFTTNTIQGFVGPPSTLVHAQANGANLDMRDLFQQGDVIQFLDYDGNNDGASRISTTVASIIDANTIQVYPPVADQAAMARNFNRIRFNVDDPVNSYQNTYQTKEFELIWKPPLSIFNINKGLPVGNYQLILRAKSDLNYQKAAIESIVADKTHNTDFQFSVEDIDMNLCYVNKDRVMNGTFLIDLDEISYHSRQIEENTALQSHHFDVHKSTHALAIALQDRQSNNSLYSNSKFVVNADAHEERRLDRYYIQYAGKQKPSPDSDLQLSSNLNYYSKVYYDTQLQLGNLTSCSGYENMESWLERGVYFYHRWDKSQTDSSKSVNVAVQMSANTNNCDVLLFERWRNLVKLTIKDGRVDSVLSYEG